uniref:Ribosomal protein L14 n=1 Tax=Physarum polycephalum TaxID=5791 RepID=F2Y9U0_PHYPO|nr:ribosomal protein L14 [Physarum polycephalum]
MRSGTVVKVADNSGPCFLRIIKILRSHPQATAKFGDHVVGSVLYTHQQMKFKVEKGSLVRAICIRIANSHLRSDGQRLRFQYPAVAIITKNGVPRGTKIFGPLPKELREQGYIRLMSLGTIAL